MGTIQEIKCEVNTSCVCTAVDEDGEEILDADGNWQYADSCYGWCWDDAVEDFTENVLGEFLRRAEVEDAILRIDGSGMGWRNLRGHAYCDASQTLEALGINSDYRLDFTLGADSFTCVRYSHDEPTGASFEIRIATAEEIEEYEESRH